MIVEITRLPNCKQTSGNIRRYFNCYNDILKIEDIAPGFPPEFTPNLFRGGNDKIG